MDVRQNTFQVIQQKTETDGEIESWIYEQARIDDDDIVAMYNKPWYRRLIKHSQQHIQIGPNGIVQKAKPTVAYFIYLAFIFRKIT